MIDYATINGVMCVNIAYVLNTELNARIPNKLWGYWYTNAWPRGPLTKVFKEPTYSSYWYAWEYTICVL